MDSTLVAEVHHRPNVVTPCRNGKGTSIVSSIIPVYNLLCIVDKSK